MGKRLWLFLTICLCTVSMAFAQNKVTGVVIEEETGEPVIGASVKVKGFETIGAATDINGRFTLADVPASAKTLVISYIGMQTKEINVKPNVKVFLSSEARNLKEQFVVAYGTATKETFTGAASVINAEVLENRSVSNVTNALAGNTSGVTAINSNGQPGVGSTIRIRGFGSINASMAPLYVVDGIPYDGDISAINSSDIESVNVLKDAAAAALYGARSANGVVLVTTKKGTRNGDATITFDAKWGANSREVKNYDVIKSANTYMETYYQALKNTAKYNLGYDDAVSAQYANANIFKGLGLQMYTLPEGESLIGADGKVNPNAKLGYSDGQYYYTPDNWEDECYLTGLRQEYNLSVSGGSDKVTYYFSAGYLNDEGTIVGSSFERISTRLNVEYQAKKWLKFGANMGFTNSKSSYPDDQTTTNSSANVFNIANNIAPIYPLYIRDANGVIQYGADGKRLYDYGDGKSSNYTRNWMSMANPTGDLIHGTEFYAMDIFNSKWYAKVQPIQQVTIQAALGLNLDNTRYNYASSSLYGQSASSGGSSTQSWSHTSGITQQYTANFKDTYGLHTVDVLGGYETYELNSEGLAGSARALYKDGDYTQNNAINLRRSSGSAGQYCNRRFITRLNYDYDNRFFGYASYTREGSSRFAPKNRWGGFFSVSGAWNMTKESFLSDYDFINLLKLRASFGQQGNDGIGNNYAYLDQYSVTGSDGKFSDGNLAYKGNPELTWEKSNSFDIAVDFDLWNGKLSGSIDYYNRQTQDMLYYAPVQPSLGYSSIPKNIGSMRNSGIEIDLSSSIIKDNNVTWDVDYNISFNSNKILKLAPELEGQLIDGSRIYEEGCSMYRLYLTKYAGVDPSTGLALYWAKDKSGKEYATSDYTVARSSNRQGTSDLLPIANGGLGTSVGFYGFDFSIQTSYQFGGKIYDSGYASLMHSGTASDAGSNWHADISKAWTPTNTITDVPRLDTADKYANILSDRFLISSNYFSINNVTLGYTLPKSITRRADINSVRVYVTADNIAILTARKGLDPRRSITSASASAYGAIRSISGGIKLTF